MKRPSPEWLLLPVFALPVLAAAALVLWARQTYHDRTAAAREEGGSVASRAIERNRRFIEFCMDHDTPGEFSAERAERHGRTPQPFRHPLGSGLLAVTGLPSSSSPWVIGAPYAGGLRPEALADPAVRLAVEAGDPPSTVPSVDEGTAAFAEICALPDAERLRSAPLPAATKLYLLQRHFDGKPLGDANALALLAAFESFAGRRTRPLTPGVWSDDAVTVVVSGRGEIAVHARDAAPRFGTVWLGRGDDVSVIWSPDGPPECAAGAEVVWHGFMEQALAGEWWVVLPHGARWWRSGETPNWLVPAVVGCAAFLFVPTALLISMRRRRRLDAARVRFVNELAHDLRTPVTSLRLHAEMLSSGRVPPGEEPRYLAVLGRETARLSALLANLLDLSRLDRGARELDLAPFDVADAVESAVRDVSAVHPSRAADLSIDVAPGLAVRADRTALARCLTNLLDNAAKFTPEGTPIRVRSTGATAGRVRIVVADDGPGVAPRDRARIFGLYERGSEAGRTAAAGTGLGLAVVSELAEAMGGRATLLDTPQGAAFAIDLPEAEHA